MATTKAKLLAEGFLHRVSFPAAMPFWVWDIEAVCETDRTLRLAEETVLRLVIAGVAESSTIAELMGLDDSDILSSTVANLMARGCLEHAQGKLAVTTGGKAVLAARSVREPAKREARVLLDPYRHKVSLLRGKGDHLGLGEARRRGLHILPILRQPTARDLAERHLDIQVRLEAESKAEAGVTGAKRKLDLIKLTALGEAQAMFLESVVEAWQRPSDGRWDWRLLVDDEEDAKAELHFRECEKEGGDVLPLASLVDEQENEVDRQLTATFEGGEPVGVEALLDAIGTDGQVSMIVPPYPFGYADLDVLLDLKAWLAEESENGVRPTVRVTFGRSPASAEAKPFVNPMRDLGELLRSDGAKVSESGGLPVRHGVLICGPKAFVCRYHQSVVQGRTKGVSWAECRRVLLENVPQSLRQHMR